MFVCVLCVCALCVCGVCVGVRLCGCACLYGYRVCVCVCFGVCGCAGLFLHGCLYVGCPFVLAFVWLSDSLSASLALLAGMQRPCA